MMSVNDKLDRLLRESRFPRDAVYETISIDFHRTQLADFVLHLLLATKEQQEKAVSYRNFNVGVGALALKPGPLGHTLSRTLGVNVKVDDTDTINIHAEDTAVGKAVDAGFDAISVLTVIGPTQEDHASGLHTHTLHPCGRCRERLDNNSVVRPDTLFVSAAEDFSKIEISDLAGIKKLHEEGDESAVTTFSLTESQELFTPLNELEARLPHVDEVDDSEWQDTVGSFLVARFITIKNQHH